jgi:CYTH domain-containing protein
MQSTAKSQEPSPKGRAQEPSVPEPAPASDANLSTVETCQKVERKFLVGELPKVLALDSGMQVSQGYLAVEKDGAEVRIRLSGNQGALCVKTGSGQKQLETEIFLTKEQLAVLWPLTEGRRMSKTTHQVEIGNTPVCLDMYEGQLSWLRIAEAEFQSKHAAESFSPPQWFHREVTDILAYRHSNLARE